MSIRNDNPVAGGTDWISGNNLLPVDLNDTFDKIVSLVNSGN